MKKNLAFFGILGLLVSACAPSTTIQSYVDPSLSRQAITEGGVTVLPVLLGINVKDANVPELRRELGKRTGESILKFFPSARVVGIEQTLNVLDSNNLLDSYTSAADAFDKTGLLRTETMNQITNHSNTRYVILPYLQNTSITVTAGFLTNATTYTATFSLVLWDRVAQKTVYEGSGKGEIIKNLFNNPNILDAAYLAFENAGTKLTKDIK